MTAELVHTASSRPERPRFRYPRRGVAFVASLADVPELVCGNEAARELRRELLFETLRRGFDEYPTMAMLEAALDMYKCPIDRVDLAELGLELASLPAKGGRA